MRWIFRIIGALAVLALLTLIVYLFLPAERLAQIAIDRLARETGREITIENAARPTLGPDLMISVEGLQVANPAWAGSRPLLEAEQATLRVGWNALFGADGTIDRLNLTGADLTLVRGEDGRLSWRNGDTSLLPLVLRQALVRDGRIRYLDLLAGTTLDVRQVTASVDLDEAAGGSAAFTASGVSNGSVMELSGSIARAARFFDGVAQPVRADLIWQEGSLRFDGTAALGGAAEGTLDLRASDLAPVARLWGREVPDIVTQLSGDAIAVDGSVTLAEGGSLHLREGVVELGETRLNAALDLVAGEDRPLLRGTITGGQIGLSDVLGVGEAASAQVWSREAYDVSGLFALDADLTVRAEELDLGAFALNALDLRATLRRGRLVFDIANIGLAEGQLAGEFVINARGGLSVGGDLLLANAQAAPVLEGLWETSPVTGRGSASIAFLGVGDDLFAILDGLEGEGDLVLSQGVVNGVDLAGLMRGDEELADSTIFDRVTAEFRVRSGAVISEDLLLNAPWGAMVGQGGIDLAERSVDYRLVPEPETEQALPVLIRGPWNVLVVEADADVVAERAAEAAAERAREAEIRRLLGGPLGIAEPDEDVIEE